HHCDQRIFCKGLRHDHAAAHHDRDQDRWRRNFAIEIRFRHTAQNDGGANLTIWYVQSETCNIHPNGENSMTLREFVSRQLAAVCLASVAAISVAQAEPANEFKPTVGQEGKDVIWVPTNQALVDKMLDLANVTKKDFVIDLGSGDGRTVITAAKRG